MLRALCNRPPVDSPAVQPGISLHIAIFISLERKLILNMKSIVVLTSYAPSLVGFRGPLIKELVSRGWRVYALAPDFHEDLRAEVLKLGQSHVRSASPGQG